MSRMLSSVALGCLLLPPSSYVSIAAAAAAAPVVADGDQVDAVLDEASLFGRRLTFDVASLPEEEPVPVEEDGSRFSVAPAPEEEDEEDRFEVAPAPAEDAHEEDGGSEMDGAKEKVKKQKKMKKQKRKKQHDRKKAKGGKSSPHMTKAPSTSATMPPTVHETPSPSKRSKKRGKAGKGAKSGSVSMSMTHSPTAGKAGKSAKSELLCPHTLDLSYDIDPGATLYYAVVDSAPAGASNGIFCGRLEVMDHKGWVGFAISDDEKMGGSTGIIGVHDEDSVLKYDLQQGFVQLAPEARQTLRDTSISHKDGKTTMEFTKLLVEEDEVPIVPDAENIFLHARGDLSDNLQRKLAADEGPDRLLPHGPSRKWIFFIELGDTAVPTPVPTPVPTRNPTSEPSPAGTSIPPGAMYYTGFEKGSLNEYQEWNSIGGPAGKDWAVTTTKPETGAFSAQAPNLDNSERTPRVTILEFNTNPAWSGGRLYYSIHPGVQMPVDQVVLYVDGTSKRDEWNDDSDQYEQTSIYLTSGPHLVSWFYFYNPTGLPPDEFPRDDSLPALNRSGVFIDNVYFVPDGTTPPPTPKPSGPPTNCTELDPNPYHFEDPNFPEEPWSTGGFGEWTRTMRPANEVVTGLWSLRSPEVPDDVPSMMRWYSNATLEICDDFTGGQLQYKILTDVLPPHDIFRVYLDEHIMVAELAARENWTSAFVPDISPGPHRIDFVHVFNPFEVPDETLVNGTTGRVWIDDVQLQSNPSS